MISLPKNTKIKNIPIAVQQLLDINFDFKKLLNNSVLDKINHDQFVFLMGIAAHDGSNFNINMCFLKKYINKIDRSKIELILHDIFIKKYETEEIYNNLDNS